MVSLGTAFSCSYGLWDWEAIIVVIVIAFARIPRLVIGSYR